MTDSDPRDKWSTYRFALSNRSGPEQGDVPSLLRSLADHLEQLGDVQVADITFESKPTHGEDELSFTVYYHRQPRRR